MALVLLLSLSCDGSASLWLCSPLLLPFAFAFCCLLFDFALVLLLPDVTPAEADMLAFLAGLLRYCLVCLAGLMKPDGWERLRISSIFCRARAFLLNTAGFLLASPVAVSVNSMSSGISWSKPLRVATKHRANAISEWGA